MKNILTIFILTSLFVGCKKEIKTEGFKPKRKYDVRLSNHIGSDWYECDSIIRISDKRFQLKNKEDDSYFVDITIPENVVLRIYTKE